jgi:hypothetical protein
MRSGPPLLARAMVRSGPRAMRGNRFRGDLRQGQADLLGPRALGMRMQRPDLPERLSEGQGKSGKASRRQMPMKAAGRMSTFVLKRASMFCAVLAAAFGNAGPTRDSTQMRCSFVQCVDRCIKTGEAPKGTYRGGGGCGKLCRQKGCR